MILFVNVSATRSLHQDHNVHEHTGVIGAETLTNNIIFEHQLISSNHHRATQSQV